MSFWVYVLRCADGSYYTGHTDDLTVRVAQHQSGAIPGYTEKRRPLTLAWSQDFPDRDQAFAAERQIKGWSRVKKEALIRGDFDALRALSIRAVLRDAASTCSAAPQDERHGRDATSTGSAARQDGRASPMSLPPPAHPEEGLSLAKARLEGHAGNPTPSPHPAIILVRPQLAENIGKAARAMLNFGLTDLRLVSPRDGWPNPGAGPAASGADIVLERARVFASVAEATADCVHVYATTVRKRGVTKPVVTPAEAAAAVHAEPGRSGFLFGAERSGLETDDVAVARSILTVPINPDFGSLNLAQAVILVAYEWSKGQDLAKPPETALDPPAPQGELDGMIEQLDAMLVTTGYYFPPDRTPTTRRTLRTMLTKPGWSTAEIRTMRGVLSALEGKKRPRG